MASTTDTSLLSETTLRDAQARVRLERRRVIDEREALAAFRTRLDRIDPPAGGGSSSPGHAAAPIDALRLGRPARSSRTGLRAVRNAYEETVMSVPHYEEDYNDTYERSLAQEFGPELAIGLTGESTLHERYYEALLSEISASIEDRERFLSALDIERDSLSRAANRLLPVVQETASIREEDLSTEGFGTLDAYRARSEALTESCDRIATRRQRDVAAVDRTLDVGDHVPDAQTYLYDECASAYPALTTVASVSERVHSLRQDVERAMFDAG